MKKQVLRIRTASGILLVLLVATPGCTGKDNGQLDFLVATEPREYEGVEIPSERIAELRADIRRYSKEVEETVSTMNRVASFQKMLANELMQQQMYEPALDALQQAMELQTSNAILYYLGGVAAGHSARAHVIDSRREEYLEKSAQLYREAVRIDPRYREALYGLAVVLAFELDRPDEALEYARRVAALDTQDPSVRFLLANVLVRTQRLSEATEIYEELARSAPSADQRRRAADNLEELRRQAR
jgi:tetratricopeptide (TPR) repeat protein